MPNFNSVQYIPEIVISSGPNASVAFDPGRFGNAYIKALNIEIGIADSPTSINVGLINELGKYPDFDLSYQTQYRLQLGSSLQIFCSLVSQKKSTSSDSVTTQLEFLDGSHILDRVFVGGVGVHMDPNEPFFSQPNTLDAQIPVFCSDCYSQQIINVADPNSQTLITATSLSSANPANLYPNGNEIIVPDLFTKRIARQSNLNFIGNYRDGGYIFLGDDKFTKTSCELPEVDYSFQELRIACQKMGITINIQDLSIQNGISTLRKSHWGTLREVLNNWCADFGISYVYDYTQELPVVWPIEIGNPARADLIRRIGDTAKLIKSGNNSLVQSIEENRTLKGSSVNNVVTTFKRGRTKREFDKTTYYGTFYKAFQTADLLTTEARSYRGVGEFNISCAIAKYDANIRSLFVTHEAITKDLRTFRALGFDANFIIDNATKNEIIDECLDTDTYRELVNFYGNDFIMIIGSYSEEFAGKMLEFETNYANEVMGKWFYTNLDSAADEKYGGFQRCFTGADWRYEISSNITPAPNDVSTSQVSTVPGAPNVKYVQSKLPFAQFLWGPLAGNYNPWKGLGFFNDPRLKVFNRTDAPWFPLKEDAENIFKERTTKGIVDLTTPFLPTFQKIEGLIETRLRARYQGTNIPMATALNGIKQKTVPSVLICPSARAITNILNIRTLGAVPNPNETPYFFSKGSGQVNKVDCSQSLKCEIQESLDKLVCDPKTLCEPFYPQLGPASAGLGNYWGKIYAARDGDPFDEGVLNTLGGGLQVFFAPPGKGLRVLTIVGPASTAGPDINDIYLANYQEHIKSSYYSQKIEAFKGSFELPGNRAEAKITLNDVSSDGPLFATVDPTTGQPIVATKIYIKGIGFLDLDQYHNFIKNLSTLGTDAQYQNYDPIKRDISVTFGNIDFGPLAQFLSPQQGLTKLSCTVDANGSSASAGWSTRSGKPPSQDLFTQEIIPQLSAKGFRR